MHAYAALRIFETKKINKHSWKLPIFEPKYLHSNDSSIEFTATINSRQSIVMHTYGSAFNRNDKKSSLSGRYDAKKRALYF